MRTDINDIASAASQFEHHLVPISPTAAVRLKKDHLNGRTTDRNGLTASNSTIENMRIDLLTMFKNDLINGVSRDHALVHAHSEYAIKVIENKMGNCSEQALLVGMFIKATLETGLKLRGYSKDEIEKADIQLAIAENGDHGGDHTACVLSYDIGGEYYLIADPWLKGATYTQQEASEFYASHLVNPDESFHFDKVCKDKTFVVNNDACVTTVMQWLINNYGIDLSSKHPFDEYLQY